jgi:phenylalanyl-tRNA synthetase beta subunit
VSPEVYDRLQLAADDPARRAVPLLNPLLADHSHLRTMILPGLLEAMRVNLHRRVEDIHLFEIGRIFHFEMGAIQERRSLGVAMRGRLVRGWNLGDEAEEATLFPSQGGAGGAVHGTASRAGGGTRRAPLAASRPERPVRRGG